MVDQPTIYKTHKRMQEELPFFARHALVIKDKAGSLIPFIFNKAQEHVHKEIEYQKKTTGQVRAIILKGRQQGCSTYVAARFYHQSTRLSGKSVFILSHEAVTTQKLYAIVERYHENCPAPLKPKANVQNRKQLVFEDINSDYTVGTAGNETIGRGATLQYFHGSEVAFWEKTDGIETGIMQAVADLPGNEMVLESTAKGLGNLFYRKCMDALQGKGDYILIFVPWFWQEEYRRAPSEDFQATAEEVALKERYGLDDSQLYWRQLKIIDLKSDWKFRQEYPMNVKDAFVTSGETLIDPIKLELAQKSKVVDPSAPLILGVDPGRTGDRTVISFRRGREFMKYLKYNKMDQMLLAGIVATLIDRHNVAKCFIDVAHGYGTIDRLKELGYGEIVTGIHFNQKPLEQDIFSNKRAEILVAVRDWLDGEGVSVPDSDELQVDFLAVPDYKETSRRLIQVEAKEKIKEKCGFSPDIYDAFALTFAYPVRSNILTRQTKFRKTGGSSVRSHRGPLRTLHRHANMSGQTENSALLGRI